jgi:uncharacterized protein (TIGR02466 family)
MSIDRLNPEHSKLVELFPIPLLSYVWLDSESLNKELSSIILAKESEDHGIQTTNVGGWHSKKDLQGWGGQAIGAVLLRMLEMGREMTRRFIGVEKPEFLTDWEIQAWANVNRRGHFNRQHHHVRNFNLWSGVYYVDTGERVTEPPSAAGARIVFADRHRVEAAGREDLRHRYSVQPETGLMLLFPSSLGHEVEPYRGNGSRITIAFNLKHLGFTTVNYETIKAGEQKAKS